MFNQSSDDKFIIDQPQSSEDPPVEQKRELKLIERLFEMNLMFGLVFGGILLFLLIAVFAWRFNLIDVFAPNKKAQATSTQLAEKVAPLPVTNASQKNQQNTEGLYITKQIIDIKDTFKTPLPTTKLTINGQFKKEVLGFLPYWAVDQVDQIDIRPYTAISYFGLEVDGDGNIVKNNLGGDAVEPWLRWQNDKNLDKFIAKAKKNRTKVYLTLKAFSNNNIEKMVLLKKSSDNFVATAMYLLNSKSIDGINIDFEYVGTPDRTVIDGFSMLISNLNKEMKRQYPKSILTVDTYVSAASTTQLHDVEMLAANSDALVIMGYDFHTPNSATSGPLAPMEGFGISLMGYMSSYLAKVPPEKLILALGYYGYDWPTADNSENSQVSGEQVNVKIPTYANIMEATKNTKINWDENSKSPWYSYRDTNGANRVVHFEDVRSLGIKYDMVNQKNLAGVGIWALGFDGSRPELMQLLVDKFTH